MTRIYAGSDLAAMIVEGLLRAVLASDCERFLAASFSRSVLVIEICLRKMTN